MGLFGTIPVDQRVGRSVMSDQVVADNDISQPLNKRQRSYLSILPRSREYKKLYSHS